MNGAMSSPGSPTRSPEAVHLAFLDGLRGLAALYVAVGHAFVVIRPHLEGQVSGLIYRLFKMLDLGHYAVAVFIVLSGYLLMLPVLRSADGRLQGGTLEYIRRRARRIWPAYFAALALSITILVIANFSGVSAFANGVPLHEELAWGSIVSHMLLVHNLFPEWAQSLNGPMWSVAFEWQIYFLLPFLILPIWRRQGFITSTLTAMLLGWGIFFLLPENGNFAWTYPWYIGLFAVGTAGATINFGTEPMAVMLRERVPWVWLTVGMIALTGGLISVYLPFMWDNLWLSDVMVGLSTAFFIVMVNVHRQSGNLMHRLLVGLLESRPLQTLGSFSYSLYLIHMPLLYVAYLWVAGFANSLVLLVVIQFAVVMPLIVVIAFLFASRFEFPFMKKRLPDRRDRALQVVGTASPSDGA